MTLNVVKDKENYQKVSTCIRQSKKEKSHPRESKCEWNFWGNLKWKRVEKYDNLWICTSIQRTYTSKKTLERNGLHLPFTLLN